MLNKNLYANKYVRLEGAAAPTQLRKTPATIIDFLQLTKAKRILIGERGVGEPARLILTPHVRTIKMKSSINDPNNNNVKKIVSNVKDNLITTKKLIDDAKYIQSVSNNNNNNIDKLNKFSQKIEDAETNIVGIDVRSHKLNEIETSFSLIEEIIEDTGKIYNESIAIGKETQQIMNDIKSHQNDKLKQDVNLLVENSKEAIKDTREVVDDLRNIYKLATGLIPFTIWGIYAVLSKRPR